MKTKKCVISNEHIFPIFWTIGGQSVKPKFLKKIQVYLSIVDIKLYIYVFVKHDFFILK